jgi:hypothetical protein
VTDPLLPPRGSAAPALPARTLALVALLALAAALLYWWPLVAGGALSGRDWSSHHFHYFAFVRASLVRHATLPLYMSDAVITPNFLANAESPIFSPFLPLQALLPTGAYLKLLIVLYTAAGLAGGFLLLRDLDVPAPVAAFFAAAYSGNGFFVSHVAAGHPWALGAQLLPGLSMLYRRAALGSDGALWLGAAVGASAILGGQHQPFLWQGLFLAAAAAVWALRVRAGFPLLRFAWLLAATIGLAAPKLLPLFDAFSEYAPTARTPGLPLGLLASSLAGRGQGVDLAPAGLVYAHGAGWWEYAFYVGPLALALLLAGLAAARRSRAGLVLVAVFLLLALDLPRALDPWRWLSELPIWRTQRSPSRFLLLALFAAVVVASLGIAGAWRELAPRRPRVVLALAWGALLLLALDLGLESRAWQRAAQGPAILERDYRPQPVSFGGPQGTHAELVSFSPNHLLYAVSAPAETALVFPLRFGKSPDEWWAGGLPVEARDGKLVVRVPSGESRIEMSYRPPYRWAGLAVCAATLLAGIGVHAARRRRVA